MAKRYEPQIGGRLKRVVQFFEKLDDARKWQSWINEEKDQLSVQVNSSARSENTGAQTSSGPLFKAVVQEWKKRIFPTLAESTQWQYEKIVRLYFGSLMDLSIHQITSQRLDQWIDELKAQAKRSTKGRKSFEHELGLLAIVFKYYGDYHEEDMHFRFPIKDRHRKDIWLKVAKSHAPKDLSAEEFERFRKELLKGPNGELMAVLATVQYFQALRISEAAAIDWEDVRLDAKSPFKSRLMICRSVVWPRKRGFESYVKAGFKNSDSNGGVKEQPLFPEAFEALNAWKGKGSKSGLVFQVHGEHLEYRPIQYAYNRAFKQAGLPYRSTHVMRHGGCRNIYNEVPDTAVAQQLLGNTTLQATLVYAKRHAGALTRVAESHWERSKKTRVAATGCKSEN